MIVITPDIKTKYPRAFRAARKERFTIKWLSDDLVYCARKAEGHGRYLVSFDLRKDGSVTIECRGVKGNQCQGEVFHGLCYHAAAVILRATRKKSKSERPIAA